MFGELGYDAATFQEIAVRADLTRPAINHYFPNKRELYRQVVGQTNGALIDAGIRRARRHEGFVERVHAFLDSTAQAHDGDRSAAAFLVTSVLESQRHPELAENDEHDALASTREFIGWALREARSAGELRPDVDLHAATETLLAMVLGAGFYAGFVGGGQGLTDVTAEFARLVRGDGFLHSS